MRDKLEACTCGKRPRFSAMRAAEDEIISQYVCQIGTRIPGGGSNLGGCGKEGPEVWDAYSDEPTAKASWNGMIRNDRAAILKAKEQDTNQENRHG